jgi:hypothetical protein
VSLRNGVLSLLACAAFALGACSSTPAERAPAGQKPDASLGGSGGSGGSGGLGGSGGSGGIAGSGGTTVVEAATAPNPPTGLVMQIVDATTIELTWVDNSGGTATYDIRWSSDPSGDAALNAMVTAGDGGVWTYRVTGLTTNQPYYFWVRAFANGVFSTDATGSKTPVTVPAKPGSFRASPGAGGTATLSWTPVIGENGYNVYWAVYVGGDAGVPTKPATPNKQLATGTTTYDVTGLDPCSQYYFWVEATNEIAAGAAAMTNAKPEIVPADPTELSVQVIGTQATVQWKDNASNESSYIVSWASVAVGTIAQKPVTGMSVAPSDAGTTMSYVINGLQAGLAYTVWVEARNCVGSSTAVSGAANTVDLPKAPTTFAAAVTGPASDVLHLTWVNVATAGDGGSTTDAKGIRIYYSTAATIAADTLKVDLPVTATSADINGLTPLATYNFWIVAFNDSGESNPPLKGTGAIGAKPAAPTGLTVDSTTSKFRMTVSWNAAAGGDGGAASTQNWKLDWTINGLPANAAPVVIPAGTTTYALTDVNVNSAYVFSLKASNVIGDSDPATSAPANSFQIAGHSGNAIKDTWIEPNGQIHLEWWVGSAGDTVGATAYSAYYAITNQRPAAGFNTQAPLATKQTYWWSAPGFLVGSTRYFWGAGAGPDGNLVWPVQLIPGPDMTGTLTFSGQTDGAMTVSWPAVAGAAGYRVRWSETATMPTGNADATNSAFVALPTTSFAITGLLSGTDYHVWVESTGHAIQNGVDSPYGLPGAVGLTAVGKSGGATYKLISTAAMTASHNTAFVPNCPAGVFPDMNAWDADINSLWGYNDNSPVGCIPLPVVGGLIPQWSTGIPWVQIDLGALHAIARVRINWQGNAGAIRYQVQGSADGTTFTNIVDVCNTTDPGGTCATPLAYSSDVWIPFTAPGGPAFPQYRYIRLVLPSNKGADYKTPNYGVKVRSIQLYEP